MKIEITGSTGLVGTALSSALTAAGHDPVRLVRRSPTGADEVQWVTRIGVGYVHSPVRSHS